MTARSARAFTLVEVLIVVVILGILAAVVIPQFNSTQRDASVSATQSELAKLRRTIGVYEARTGALPTVAEGFGLWGEILTDGYLNSAPMNQLVGGLAGGEIRFGEGPVVEAPEEGWEFGWIYDPETGEVWAAGFGANDEPLP